MLLFSKHVGITDSNEVKIPAIEEAIKNFSICFGGSPRMESDSSNAISWVSTLDKCPWKFHFHLSEITFSLLLSRLDSIM